MVSLLSLLASAHPAQAQTGHYWSITYTTTPSGVWSYNSSTNNQNANGYWPTASNYYSLNGSDKRSNSISGNVVATLTWIPASGQTLQSDPPPSPVSVIEYGYAQENSSRGTDPNLPAGPAGSADDGLSDSEVPADNGYISTGYRVVSRTPNASGVITVSDTLSAVNPPYSMTQGYPPYTRWPNGANYVNFTVYPVTLNLSGTTQDSSGNQNILVGQWCKASLTGFPSGCSVTYQWSVTGTTFQSWTASSANNVDASSYVDGPGPLTNSTADWYWNDFQSPTLETVSCTATVKPPAGQGSAFNFTLSKQVKVYRPQFTATGFGGGMEVSTTIPSGNGTDFWLWAGALPGTSETGGMDWYATVAPPLGTGTLFGSGTVQLVQLIIPNETYTDVMGDTLHNSENGQEGLDIYYPFGWLISGAPNYHSADQPGLDLTSIPAMTATIADQFLDYLMYYPPNSAQCVPLAEFVWTINGSASVPWTYTAPGSAGSVSPSNKSTNFGPNNGWPMWTQIDDPANEHWE